MIAVMGATGNTGKLVAERLLAAGEKVRVLGRSAERVKPFVERGAEAAVGEVSDRAYLTSALRGAEAAYTLLPPNYTTSDYLGYYQAIGEATAQAIRESGVRRAVFLSSLGAEIPSGTGPIAGLHDQEERLKTIGGIDLLLLRPGYFFENHFGTLGLIKHQGLNGGAIEPGVPIAMIAAHDIGEAAAEALRKRDFSGVVVRELLGPRDLTMAQATRILGEKIGKPDLQYLRFADEDFLKSLVQAGFSPKVGRLFVEMSRALNQGKVRSLEGRNPRNTTATTFESFAEELAGAYRAM